jgi:hypothetical protein
MLADVPPPNSNDHQRGYHMNPFGKLRGAGNAYWTVGGLVILLIILVWLWFGSSTLNGNMAYLVASSFSATFQTDAATVHKVQFLRRSGIEQIKIFERRGRPSSVDLLVSHAIAESKPTRN